MDRPSLRRTPTYCPQETHIRAQEEKMVDKDDIVANMKYLTEKMAQENDATGSWQPMSDELSCITEYSLPLSDIEEPEAHDVVFGSLRYRSGERHTGNQHFRLLVNDFSESYRSAQSEEEKEIIVIKVVRIWRSFEPPGRFLVQTNPTSRGIASHCWHDIGDEEARRRTASLFNNTHYEEKHKYDTDDVTASTVSSWSLATRPVNKKGQGSDCFGGSFRAAVMGLFAWRTKDGIMNQYLP